MKIDYLTKVGAAVTAFFTPTSDGLIGGKPAPTELVTLKSVAIIGGGAGGTSTAYFLNNYLQSPHLHYKHDHASITVFEQSDKIGGRCMVFRVKNNDIDKDINNNTVSRQRIEYVEVGASIFVNLNHHLVNAAKTFGLETKKLDDEKAAIWDGQQFIFEESDWKLWSVVKALRRWGLAPLKLKRVLKKSIDGLMDSYTNPESFDNIAQFAERFQLNNPATQLASQFLNDNGIGAKYSHEVVEVATRVNYGSNLDELHALGAMVSMAADDALQVKGGNFQIFEGMLARSQAKVKLNAKVARVKKLKPEHEGAEPRFEVTTTNGQKEIFDHVVIAAPIHSMNIDFDLGLPPLPRVEYRTIHATFVRGHLNPDYFHLTQTKDKKLPTHILTTHTESVEFTSVSIQVQLFNGETVTKIFSPKAITDELLDRLYTTRTWVKRKEWKAYPQLVPIRDLDPTQSKDQQEGGKEEKEVVPSPSEIHQYILQKHTRKTTSTSTEEEEKRQQQQAAAQLAWGQVEVVPGVFYVNAFEPLISTMETETIAGKNVARLLRDKILGYCAVEKLN
ncbi:hypothetical protein BG004_001691 [Podila humilis]|nr:hypothetical protein BG004_001691 [Podila humilis]